MTNLRSARSQFCNYEVVFRLMWAVEFTQSCLSEAEEIGRHSENDTKGTIFMKRHCTLTVQHKRAADADGAAVK